MNTLEQIKQEINLLDEGASQKESDVLRVLMDQITSLYFDDVDHINNVINGDDDCLNGMEQDSGFYETVRNIQDRSVCFLSE